MGRTRKESVNVLNREVGHAVTSCGNRVIGVDMSTKSNSAHMADVAKSFDEVLWFVLFGGIVIGFIL